ncbi:MAG TPA: M14 family zinc carboxypeptidase, partial [Actinomycetota bacterium]|nr:M14 family zinc carboxypeptidase [Actinomycetota bacterium]
MIAALLTAASFAGLGGGDAAAQDPPPRTGFEQRNGSSWTTHAEELAFLSEVDRRSDRVELSVVGTTLQNRPIHLVRVGHPVPRDVAAAQTEPVVLFVCTQHG